jgi:hypothetical protein
MPGFQVEGDLELNADETDLLLVAGTRAVEQQIRTGALNWTGYTPYGDVGLPMTTDILGKALLLRFSGNGSRALTALFRWNAANLNLTVPPAVFLCYSPLHARMAKRSPQKSASL